MKIDIGIDTGGTYTDAVAWDAENRRVLGWAKALTTKEDLSVGIANALDGLPQDALKQARVVSLSTTLATNACVEDKGSRAKLVLIGANPRTVASWGGEYGLPPAGQIWMLDSECTMQGQVLREPDWDAFMAQSEAWFADADAVAIVEVMAMWNNAVLEKKAREIISRKYRFPVICGHDLFSDLNSLQRAAGALLNARLIPIVEGFLRSVKKALAARGVSAPVAIVRSDGSLMSEAFTALRPVETLLCGPAASLKGGVELAGEKDCLVVDMGGTTTDVAVVKDGVPVRATEGIRIGRWSTFVRGVLVETFGLGGDSAVRFDRRGNLTLGPERVIPLCAAAARWPGVSAKLARLTASVKRHSEPLHEFWCPVLDVSADPRYTDAERAFSRALRDGPLILREAAAAAGSDAYHIDTGRLEREGAVIRAGLTPTDVMHIRGDFGLYDRQASALGADFTAGCLGMTVEELCESVYDMARERLYTRIARLLLEHLYPDWRRTGYADGLEPFLSRCWRQAGRGGGFAEAGIRTNAALVGVGAPVHVFLPAVAKALGTRCVIPENAGVANALGAVTGSVTAVVEVSVGVDCAAEGIRGYIVYGREATVHTGTLEEAVEAAKAEAARAAEAEARLRGAEGDVSVTVFVHEQRARAAEAELLLGVTVAATATGGMTL